MATNNHNQLQLHEMDHIQPVNGQHNEPVHLGQKLLLRHGHDAALRIGPSGRHGSTAVRLNDVPSSSHAAEFLSYRVGSSGNSHTSFIHCPSGSSSSHLPEPSVSYPRRSEGSVPPVSSHLESIRATLKRKNPIVHPVDGTNTGGYHVGSSSNAQLSNYVQPNPIPLTEPFTQMPLSIGQSGWDGQQLLQQEGFQRNVRARHNHNIMMEPRLASTHTANNIYPPPHRSTASASLSTLVARNQPPTSVPPRTLPSGAPGITGRAFIGRTHYPTIGSNNSTVAAAPTLPGSSGNATLANGGYAPRTVNNIYSHPALTGPSSTGPSGSRVSLDTVIRSYPPGFSAATSSTRPSGSRAVPLETVIRSCPPGFSAAASTSMRIGQPFPTIVPAHSRHARHVAIGHANSGRNRRARSAYYAFHPSMMEAEGLMLDQLIFYESREAADPHRDMRLDVDNMSYEDLLALGEFIGNVNTGVTEDKISDCVREVVCCSSESSDPSQSDEDDGTCVVCLEGYKDKDLLGILKCNHDFHAECIKKWLQLKNSCPVCKAAAA